MIKLPLDKILELGSPDCLIIRSLSCGLYRVEATLDQTQYILANKKGDSLTFHSHGAVKELCQKLQYTPKAVFLHQSTTYGEMIGFEPSSPEPCLMPLAWGQPE